jgi:MSHA type pilus biogenesis protein MshL
MNIAVNQADLKDILRAATADTDLNLIFAPGLDTRVEGLNLKAMRLQEILDDVLPRLGMVCVRQGRTLLIQPGDGMMRFYHVDLLAMSRTGSKSFMVNASGQVLQGGTGGIAGNGGIGGSPGTAGNAGAGAGAGGNSSAFSSSVETELSSDPWADLESGLMLLVFGTGPSPAAPAGQGGSASGSRGFTSDGKTLLIQPSSGLVVVGADPAIQKRVSAYLQELRQRTQRQVLLEARIVEVTLTNESQFGMNWQGLLSSNGNPASASLSTGPVTIGPGLLQVVAQSGRVQATLSALALDNRLKVLSAPRLSTLNNQEAILRVVTEQPYAMPSSQITPGTAAGGAIATSQLNPLIVPTGIILDILPQVGDDGVITLSVNPSISDVSSVSTLSVPGLAPGSTVQTTVSLPVVDRRDLDTVVRIKSGETLVLAGIIRTREQAANNGVPWLRKVPIIGGLFANNSKTQNRTELAIFITPTLIEDSGQIGTETRKAEQRLDSAGAELNPPPPPARPSLKTP